MIQARALHPSPFTDFPSKARTKGIDGDFTPEARRAEVQKLENLLTQSTTILYKTSSVFPFAFFPIEVIIDEVKINVLYRTFFGSGVVRSIELTDVTNVSVQAGIIFALLKIESRWFPNEPIEIKYLKKGDALKARRIIQGLKIGTFAQIDYSKIDHSTLRANIEELGKTKGTL